MFKLLDGCADAGDVTNAVLLKATFYETLRVLTAEAQALGNVFKG
jgi:hypothetical protein